MTEKLLEHFVVHHFLANGNAHQIRYENQELEVVATKGQTLDSNNRIQRVLVSYEDEYDAEPIGEGAIETPKIKPDIVSVGKYEFDDKAQIQRLIPSNDLESRQSSEILANYSTPEGSFVALFGLVKLIAEDSERQFLLALISRNVDNYFFQLHISELLIETTPESDEKSITTIDRFQAIVDSVDDKGHAELHPVGNMSIEVSEDKKVFDEFLAMINFVRDEALVWFARMGNRFLLESLIDGVPLVEDVQDKAFTYKDNIQAVVTHRDLGEEETPHRFSRGYEFDSTFNDNQGQLATIHVKKVLHFEALDPDDFEEGELEDDEYSDDPTNIVTAVTMSYLERVSNLEFKLELWMETEDNNSDTASLKVYAGNALVQTVELSIEAGLQRKDDFHAELQEYLEEKHVSMTLTIQEMMSMLDATLGALNFF